MSIPVNPNKPIPLLLHPNDLDYIARCLHERPYKEVAPLLAQIQNQVIQHNLEEAAENQPPVSRPDTAEQPEQPELLPAD